MDAAREAAERHGVLHADHDGSGRGPGVPRRHAARAHQGRARRRRVGHARGPEGRLQGLQPARARRSSSGCRRSARTASTCSARSSSACRATGRRRSTTTAELAERAGVTFAQFVMLTPFPGTVDFERWEKDDGRLGAARRRHPGHAALAHSAGPAPEGLHAAPGDVGATRSARARRACGTSSTACRAIWQRSTCVQLAEGAPGVRADLEAVPADVREHRHRDRLGAPRALGEGRASHREGVPQAVHRGAHARSRGAAGRGGVARVPDGVARRHLLDLVRVRRRCPALHQPTSGSHLVIFPVPGSGFHVPGWVPGSTFRVGFRVPRSGLVPALVQRSNVEPGTNLERGTHPEPGTQPGTWNPERGTARLMIPAHTLAAIMTGCRRQHVLTADFHDRASLRRYAWLSIAAALATMGLKAAAYIVTDSVGLLSDAVESLVNLVGALMALWMLTVAAREPDEEHAYGHTKAEYFSSGVEGSLILVAALSIAGGSHRTAARAAAARTAGTRPRGLGLGVDRESRGRPRAPPGEPPFRVGDARRERSPPADGRVDVGRRRCRARRGRPHGMAATRPGRRPPGGRQHRLDRRAYRARVGARDCWTRRCRSTNATPCAAPSNGICPRRCSITRCARGNPAHDGSCRCTSSCQGRGPCSADTSCSSASSARSGRSCPT